MYVALNVLLLYIRTCFPVLKIFTQLFVFMFFSSFFDVNENMCIQYAYLIHFRIKISNVAHV